MVPKTSEAFLAPVAFSIVSVAFETLEYRGLKLE